MEKKKFSMKVEKNSRESIFSSTVFSFFHSIHGFFQSWNCRSFEIFKREILKYLGNEAFLDYPRKYSERAVKQRVTCCHEWKLWIQISRKVKD